MEKDSNYTQEQHHSLNEPSAAPSHHHHHTHYAESAAPQHHHHHHHHHHQTEWKKTAWGKAIRGFVIFLCFLILFILILIVLRPQTMGWINTNILGPLSDGVSLFQPSNIPQTLNYDGLDISHHQGLIDWDKVAQDKQIKFVYIKATEGSDHVDEYYARNVAGATKAGIPVGAYHYLTSGSALTAQVANFARTVNPQLLELRPMVDIEAEGVKGWSKSQIADSLEAFVTLMQKQYHIWPIIYSYTRFFKENLSPRFNEFHLFLAHYENNAPIVKGALRHSLWQHTDQGSIDGIPLPVDLDVFFPGATLADLTYPEELK
jgi:lysozyme